MTTYLPTLNPHNQPQRLAMPAVESMIHSHGVPLTFPMLDGTEVSIRQGCVLDESGRTLAGSKDAADYVLRFGQLTDAQYGWVDTVARHLWPTCGNERASYWDSIKNKTG